MAEAAEKKTPNLDPNGKYLIQEGSGAIFGWTERLAKRKDMRPYDPSGRPLEPGEAEKKVPIELQGQTFMVSPDLFEVLIDMGKAMLRFQEENAKLKAAEADYEAFKVRMDTDKTDLEEQLAAAQARIAEFESIPEETEQPDRPERKGRK